MQEPGTTTVDILILGAGPAGLSTALHLARAYPALAKRVLVLEKSHHPRPKLCAGGLVIDAEIILERLGLDVAEIPHADAREMHFDFAGRGFRIRPGKKHALRIIRREEFDAWLAAKARAAGIEIQEGVTVREMRVEAERVVVETEAGVFEAQVAVGADGSNGVTRRCILPHAASNTARVLEVITPGEPFQASERNGQGGYRTDKAYFDFLPVLSGIEGYTWDFPTQIQGRPARCWGIYDANLFPGEDKAPLRGILAEEMAHHGFDLEAVELQGHPIHWFDPREGFSVPRILLVGDAAGADSLLGEGISMALGYGTLAAQEIGEAFRKGDLSFSGYKRRLARSGLGRALFARWVLANILYNLKWRWFQFLLWRCLKPVMILVAWLFVVGWAGKEKFTIYD